MKDKNNFYSVDQFRKLIGVGVIGKTSIYLRIKNGEIPVTYFGTKALIPADWVEEFCKSAKLKVD